MVTSRSQLATCIWQALLHPVSSHTAWRARVSFSSAVNRIRNAFGQQYITCTTRCAVSPSTNCLRNGGAEGIVQRLAEGVSAVGMANGNGRSNSSRTITMSLADIAELESKLLYNFQDKKIVAEAMIHSSCCEYKIYLEGKSGLVDVSHLKSNERCEWLGDKVYGILISSYLFSNFPNSNEGALSKLYDSIASRNFASSLCVTLDLHKHLVCSPSLPSHVSTAAAPRRYGNFLESCLGALFRAGGESAARRFFNKQIVPHLKQNLPMHSVSPNYRGRLQELLMQCGYRVSDLPRIIQIKNIGTEVDPSNPSFCQALKIHGSTVALGTGTSKTKAAQAACRLFLSNLEDADTEIILRTLRELESKQGCSA